MTTNISPQVVTANALLEGDVVYLSAKGDWVRDLASAHVLTEPTQAEALLATAQGCESEVVGAYLADVRVSQRSEALPAHFREAFRATGPSNYFHGKQSEL